MGLVDADPENLARFKDVLDYLKRTFIAVQNSLMWSFARGLLAASVCPDPSRSQAGPDD
jgi:hypothetical protein